MPRTNPKYLLHHLQYVKTDAGFLFGNYELAYCTPNVTEDIFKYFETYLKIEKCYGGKHSIYPNPNKIGSLLNGQRPFSNLYYLPNSINHLFHARLEVNPRNHLLLIEHPFNEQTLDITIVPQSAHTPWWGAYTKDWEEGLFEERIKELKKQLINLNLGE